MEKILPTETSTDSWKPILASLANQDQRTILSRLILGQEQEEACRDLSVKKRDRALKGLVDSKLLTRTGTDLAVDVSIFRQVLQASAPQPVQGIQKYLDGPRILQYPKNPSEREDLLQWVVRHAFRTGESLTEGSVNDRLFVFSSDVATLRRFLVDHGFLMRSREGGIYELKDS